MFKSLLVALLVFSSAVFAQAPANSAKEEKDVPYIYQPEKDIRPVDPDHIMVQPQTPGTGSGVGQWCNTLRGKGLIIIATGEVLIFIAVDCPDQPTKDI